MMVPNKIPFILCLFSQGCIIKWSNFHYLLEVYLRCCPFLLTCSDAADKVVVGQGKFEELVVASHDIAASTAQLVAASRVKARPKSEKLKSLKASSRDGKAVIIPQINALPLLIKPGLHFKIINQWQGINPLLNTRLIMREGVIESDF